VKISLHIINIRQLMSTDIVNTLLSKVCSSNIVGLSSLDKMLILEPVLEYITYEWLVKQNAVVISSLILDTTISSYQEVKAILFNTYDRNIELNLAGVSVDYDLFITNDNIHVILMSPTHGNI